MAAIIKSVAPDSIAADLDWRVGDEVVSVNGKAIKDVFDFYYLCDDENVDVEIKRGGEQAVFEIEKDAGESLGITFEDILFDGMHSCGAHCIFCFVEQLPPGMRKTLYVKDDDYRLSFLQGNFVTMANVSDEELEKIALMNMSPLYISVHTTEPELRDFMLGRKCPNILDQLAYLKKRNIEFHTQIVLCRGVNDGEHLVRSIDDLIAVGATSIAVVPAGLTVYRRNKTPIGTIDPKYSKDIIRLIKYKQRRCLRTFGSRIVWAADEFYLNAGRNVPSEKNYEGYMQIENGIGLVRKFLESGKRARKITPPSLPRPLRVTLATGMLAEKTVSDWASSVVCENLTIDVVGIKNTVFGETITVTGLMCGGDVIKALKGRDLGDAALIPDVCLRDAENTFLDDVTLADVEKELGTKVFKCPTSPYGTIKLICSDKMWEES